MFSINISTRMTCCEKCGYLFNITKDVKSKQIGGKINSAITNILTKYSNNDKIVERDLKKITGKDLLDDERYEEMTKKEQKKLVSNIRAINRNFFVADTKSDESKIGTNTAYYICVFCNFFKPIPPATLLYSKDYGGSNATENTDYTYAIYDMTLSGTNTYICQNAKCPTHTDSAAKQAVLTKNELSQDVYICKVCQTHWIESIQS